MRKLVGSNSVYLIVFEKAKYCPSKIADVDSTHTIWILLLSGHYVDLEAL